MSREKLVARVIQKLETTSKIVGATDHDKISQVENEIQSIEDVVRQLDSHLNYLGAMQPVPEVDMALAYAFLSFGSHRNSIEALTSCISEGQMPSEAKRAVIDEFHKVLRERKKDIEDAITSLERLVER